MNKIKLLIVAILMSSCINDKVNESPSTELVNLGDPLPLFRAESVTNSGKYINNDSLSNKVVLLVLFTTECGDCRRELPKIEAAWDTFKTNPDFKLVAISRVQSRENVSAYWTDNNFELPTYLDPDRNIFAKFASSTVPRVYLTDKTGVVVKKWIEVMSETSNELIAIVNNQLN